jgi:hypothetical protein
MGWRNTIIAFLKVAQYSPEIYLVFVKKKNEMSMITKGPNRSAD